DSARSVSAGSTFAPSSGFTGLPYFGVASPVGHTEQATPVGAPISTPAEPCTISSPLRVMSPCRAAGFPPMNQFLLLLIWFIWSLHQFRFNFLHLTQNCRISGIPGGKSFGTGASGTGCVAPQFQLITGASPFTSDSPSR